jgi:two-component system, OmpR family, phosphate regulon sensor histidine kinase PhoR
VKLRRIVLVLLVLTGFFVAGLANILPFWLAYLAAAVFIAVFVFLLAQENRIRLDKIEKSYHREILASDKDRILKTKQLEIVFQNIPTPLALMNLKGEIAMNNEPFRRFYVKQPPAVVDYLSDAIQMEIRSFMKDSYLKESSLIKNIHVIDRDYLTLAIPFQENKRYSGCLLIFQDVTFYTEGDRMQKRFIADASHELRTPLAAIKGMVEILNRPDFDDDATRDEFLRQIEQESSRMETIIQDLLSLSRISANKVILQTQRVSLHDVVENSFSTLKQEFQTKGVQFINETEACGAITMDPQKMHTVFTNLFANAINSTDEGFVKVSCVLIGSAVEIKVQDSGAGIPAADLPHIFDRFYRVEKHRSRSSGGSGLGLAIVKGVVEAHGGILGVTSIEGVGTTFTLTIPAN